MRNRLFVLLVPVCLALAGPALAAPVHSYDAAKALPAELAREAQASPPGALFRITGLRGADGEPLTLALETARLFADDFHLYVDGRDLGGAAVARLTFLRGTVEEMPFSSVALTLDGATGSWSGTIAAGERIYAIDLPAGASRKALSAAATVRPVEAEPLARSAVSDALQAPPGTPSFPAPKAAAKPIVPPGVSYQATIAIETDYELFHLMKDDVGITTTYLSNIMNDVAELYVRQLGVSLSVTSLSLYTNPDDPWNAPNPHGGENADVLCEFGSYWQRNRPVRSFPRNGAIFFTGKKSYDIGGQAWVSSICRYDSRPSDCPFGGYGIIVIQNRRPFETVATAHELGHMFGTHHTHCYNPPIDMCHSGEEGCYSGAESVPPDGGSVMSYCSPARMNMGEPGKFGLDSQRVVEVIGSFVGQIGPTCLGYSGAYSLAGEAAPASATLTWTDPFNNETNWLVEQKVNGKFKQVKSLPPNATSVTITKLKPGPTSFRIRAKIKSNFGIYSDVVTVTVP